MWLAVNLPLHNSDISQIYRNASEIASHLSIFRQLDEEPALRMLTVLGTLQYQLDSFADVYSR